MGAFFKLKKKKDSSEYGNVLERDCNLKGDIWWVLYLYTLLT